VQAERDAFNALWGTDYAGGKLWVEGVLPQGQQGDGKSSLTMSYFENASDANPLDKVTINYTLFGATVGRQPTPAEWTVIKPDQLPNLVDCEWSITDEPTLPPGVPANLAYSGSPGYDAVDWAKRWYNCYAWTVDETTLFWDGVIDPAFWAGIVGANNLQQVLQRVKSIDAEYGKPRPDGSFQIRDLDNFYEFRADVGPIGEVKNAKVISYGPMRTRSEHGALKKDEIADSQLLMFESKLGVMHRIYHVWNQLDGGAFGRANRYYWS